MPNSYYGNPENTQAPPENTQQQSLPQTQPTPFVPPAPQVQETENQNEISEPMTNSSTGQLVVSVFTANQLYPVVDATVSVSLEDAESNDILDSSDTDRSGRSKTFTLPAPSATMSQEPTVAIPFAEYRVSITHPDYFNAVIENVQLFGGVLTQLPVNLVPLPEFPDGETTKIVIIPRQNL